MNETKQANAIRRRVKANIKIIPPEQAKEILEEIAEIKKRIWGIGNKTWVRILTGGYWSQSLDYFCMRELGKQAGLINEPKSGFPKNKY